ncbi:transposase [Streptomyces sp. NPDC050619]|uniref:transposase n=1 Tax=Streptomyces sp. NPDC050619 TaxID=3157214 RepID=UPI0034124085
MRGIRYTGSPDQLKTLAGYRKGESDLVQRDGKWFLIATCDIPDPEVYEPADWIGVDRGVVNLATTSDGTNYQGRRLNRYRRWQARKRAELQAKQSRSATRRLARRAKREQRHATHVNHRISKEIVSVAQRTGRGVAVEQLDGIRERVRLRRDQRGTLSSWPFHQLALDCARAGGTPTACRPRRRGQRAQPCALGVGVRHRTRPRISLNRPERGEMRPVTVLS